MRDICVTCVGGHGWSDWTHTRHSRTPGLSLTHAHARMYAQHLFKRTHTLTRTRTDLMYWVWMHTFATRLQSFKLTHTLMPCAFLLLKFDCCIHVSPWAWIFFLIIFKITGLETGHWNQRAVSDLHLHAHSLQRAAAGIYYITYRSIYQCL